MSGLAVLPALGGTLFVAFLAAAQFADVKVQRAESMGRRVLPRPWSIVSDDACTPGHWLTLAAACIFATTVPATSIWQNKAVADENDVAMIVAACIAAAGFFLMALVPHRDSRSATSVTFSAAWHFTTAGCFLAAGTVHATRVAVFALDAFESQAMFIARIILMGLMAVCVLAQVFGALTRQIDLLTGTFGGMERINNTPLPFVYVSHLRTSLTVYLTLVPIVFAPIWLWATPFLTLIVAWALLGIEAAAVECERPVRGCANHMPLEAFCAVVADNVRQTLQHSASMGAKLRSR